MKQPSASSWPVSLLVAAGLLAAGGCESLQRKFIRQSKADKEKPTPIIAFQDYSAAMTPLDRYRKHYLLFTYWNNDLIAGLKESRPNEKRLKRASGDGLEELRILQTLLTEEKGAELAPFLEERQRVDRQIRHSSLNAAVANTLGRQLETQSRVMRRGFYWREIENHLKPAPEPPPTTTAAEPEHEGPT